MMNSSNLRNLIIFLFVFSFSFTSLQISENAIGADHTDAPAASAEPEIDITDAYAFLDPDDESRLVLAMGVVPFIEPTNDPNAGFADDVLYQFKIDNNGDGVEDFVVQVLFEGNGFNQEVRVLGPAVPDVTGAVNQILTIPASIEGNTQEEIEDGDFRLYAGLADDAFVADLDQLNAILAGDQDVFRAVESPVLGQLSGRALNPDGTSGVDFFSGVNTLHIVLSFPKEIIRGDGIFGIPGLVGIWATTSHEHGDEFEQIERMGQALFNTVFVPADMKDEFNSSIPENDTAMFSNLVPDTLTQEDNDNTGNTIEGRSGLLELIGLVGVPNGSPLLLPADFVHPLVPTADLLRVALLPDFIRIDIDRPAADQAIGLFGLQNGRRPQDDTVDIALLLLRQLTDVNFPAGSGVPGSGDPREGALDCTVLPDCPDRRVLAVLQGTDWIKEDALIEALRLDLSGNDSEFPAAGGQSTVDFLQSIFNFMALILFPESEGGDGCSLANSNIGKSFGSFLLIPALVLGIVFRRRLLKK